MIHHPFTAKRPAISRTCLVEDRPTGTDRVWVVNQDNDSVSVFNSSNDGRLATINVGTAPRSIAIARERRGLGDQQAARRSASSTHEHARGVAHDRAALRRRSPSASSPHPTGIGLSSRSRRRGRLLKLDAVDGMRRSRPSRSAPNPRHVAVSGGRQPRVRRRGSSRRRLPGESTAPCRRQWRAAARSSS